MTKNFQNSRPQNGFMGQISFSMIDCPHRKRAMMVPAKAVGSLQPSPSYYYLSIRVPKGHVGAVPSREMVHKLLFVVVVSRMGFPTIASKKN
jgi:hypothetical protein